MRPRALIEVREDHPMPMSDTYERVRRTLDDALAELELPRPRKSDGDADRSAPHAL